MAQSKRMESGAPKMAGRGRTTKNNKKADCKAEQKAEPSTWDQTKEMTRKEWDVAKKKWAQEKVKWNDCNRQSSKEKLEAPKSWSFIASCMTKT